MTISSNTRCCDVNQKKNWNKCRFCPYNIKHNILNTRRINQTTIETMESFLNKKYKLDRCENLEELLNEMGELHGYSIR